MKKTKLVIRGKKLRQDGFSFREIGEILHISKSTASLWLWKEKMTRRGQERFNNFILDSSARGVRILANKNQINIYNKKNTGIRKKDGYSGCISINYYNYKIFDEVMLIIKRFNEFVK
jgi:hypothetical protein